MINEYYNVNYTENERGRRSIQIAAVVSIFTEIISIIRSFSYASKYDETDSGLSMASAIVLLVGLLGRTAGFVVVQGLASKLEDCTCKDPNDPQGHNLCIKYLIILSLPFVDPLQLLATIFMMVSNTENDATKFWRLHYNHGSYHCGFISYVWICCVDFYILSIRYKKEQEPANL